MQQIEEQRARFNSENKKSFVNCETQTDTKKWSAKKPDQSSLDYFATWLKENDCEDITIDSHIAEWRSNENNLEQLKKKSANLERENRVQQKRADDFEGE